MIGSEGAVKLRRRLAIRSPEKHISSYPEDTVAVYSQT